MTIKFLQIILCIAVTLFTALTRCEAQNNAGRQFTIVIDPGHGGKDPGAIGRGKTKEKTINLNVSKSVGQLIKERYPEVKVIYTRSTDKYISLIDRANIANKAKADLFVSIHTNAAKNRKARGCETFTLGSGSSAEAKAAAKYENEVILQEENFEQVYGGFDPNSNDSYIIFDIIRTHDMESSISLADKIQTRMTRRSKLHNRGVSSAGFLVLHQTAMPSVLVELGFISNPTEEKFLASKSGQTALAKGVFEGISAYYENYKKSSIPTNTAPVTVECDEDTEQPKADKQKSNDAPIFKVQILTSSKKLKSNDKRFKGVKADCYKEGGIYKYTCGASTDYNAMARKRKELAKKFKEAFIVAFKNGRRIDINKAKAEFEKKNK